MAKIRLSPKEKLLILDEVLKDGQKVSDVCRKWGISRFSFYQWARNWEPATNLRRAALIQNHLVTGKNHYKSIKGKREKLVLECVLKNPNWSSHKISRFLNEYDGGRYKVSSHGAHTVLTSHGLNIRAAREEYKRKHLTHSVFPSRFSDFEKYRIIEEFQKGKKIAQICREFYISRYTFYEWLKKYEKERTVASLVDQRPRRENHWRYVGETARQQVLDLVAKNPKYSVHRLHSHLAGVVGHHGIQNILWREDLNTMAKRQQFVQELIPESKVPVVPLYEPQVPLFRLRQLLAPFVTVPKLVITKPRVGLLTLLLCLLPFLIISLWIRTLLSVPTASIIGLIFASIALTLGIFFFVYSLKYYLSVLLTLRLSQSAGGEESQKGRVNPLLVNLEKVELKQRPFVSIHVAVYNEKKVIERLIQACMSQAWTTDKEQLTTDKEGKSQLSDVNYQMSNYEVVIVDDSTDETTEIAKQTLVDNGWKLSSSNVIARSPSTSLGTTKQSETEIATLTSFARNDSGEEGANQEVFVFTPLQPFDSAQGSEGQAKPVIKLIHRFSRSGFKGGALQTALEHTDARAEYVCVFDSDFVPYPDTIEQFVKTFQVLSPNNAEQDAELRRPAGVIPREVQQSSANPIAAVQGYQWHVLNKSENWITRGVRTEYAGSYVIERAGTEIYGGLKQIAGSVYAIRADILRQFGWGKSITEDFELTLRLYEAGYKVAFTPYIQAPAEAVSTVRRLIRQRMRWAEGASFNVKCMFSRMLFGKWVPAQPVIARNEVTKQSNSEIAASSLDELGTPRNDREGRAAGLIEPERSDAGRAWVPSPLSLAEKLEFLYLAPYYLQAAFFVIGTLSWFISEAVFHTRLPFWTATLGWSLVFSNFLSLPLMNITGLFLEESDERDYLGILSFVVLSYIMVPFAAYAAIKGFLESQEGPWFRTPKTGVITDVIGRARFYRWMGRIFAWGKSTPNPISTFALTSSLNSIPTFNIRPRNVRFIGNLAFIWVILITLTLSIFAPLIPTSTSYALQPALKTVEEIQKNQSQSEKSKVVDPKNPANKDELIKNALSQEITTPRVISKTTKDGKKLEFIFHQEPRVRVKLEGQEIEFETKAINGKGVSPQKSEIYQDKEVIYEEIVKDIDLKYSLTNDLLVEEFVLKKPTTFTKVEQTIKTIDVKVVSFDNKTFGFYSEKEEGKELFKLSQPFAKDAKGEVSNDLSFTLDKASIGYKLAKTVGYYGKQWLADPNRVYPVTVDPSVIVSGGIAETEVQFGGLQRKLVYASDNFYAFYNDATDVFYRKCAASSGCDEAGDWSSAVDVDTTDADNLNPSVWLEGSLIYVTWIDDSGDAIEVNTINTASSDALGTKCTSADQGTIDTTSFTVSVTVSDDGTVYFAYSDTSTDTEAKVFKLVFSGCTFTDIKTGSGLTAGDRPVIISTANTIHMIFQDGQISRSTYADGAWNLSNDTIASVADNVYDVTTDGTAIWILTVSGTAATNFYRYDTVFIEDIDQDAGASGQAGSIYCPAADDCKIVYYDRTDGDITFVDCNNANCDAPTLTDIDTDVGAMSGSPPKIYCSTATNCKIVYFDATDGDVTFADCNDETCSAPTITDIDTSVSNTYGGSAIYCPASDDCKVVYHDGQDSDIIFADCNDETCSAPTITYIDTNAGAGDQVSIDCPAADDCKVVYQDLGTDTSGTDDVTFIDCNNVSCSSRVANDLDTDVGSNDNDNGLSIYCLASDDCKVVYFDATDGDITFVNCEDDGTTTDCSAPTINDIDTDVGTLTSFPFASVYCPASDDCKVLYGDNTDGDISFIDCADASCSGAIGTEVDIDNSTGVSYATGGIYCPTASDCKLVYFNADDQDVTFVDCSDGTCGAASTLTVPWTGQTNLTSATISYDSANSDLYAMVIKDNSEQAYFKSTDATTISWSDETSLGFTAGDLGHISSPMTGAGPAQIGVVLRQGSNFEFAVVPEKTIFLLATTPFLGYMFRRFRKRKR